MTNYKLGCITAGLVLSLVAVQGALADPVACNANGTVQDLINSGGCTISVGGGGSLLFTDFTFTPSGGALPATQVGYSLVNGIAGPGGAALYGFDINPGLQVNGVPGNQDELLRYTIVAMGTAITSNDLQTNANATGTGLGQVTENITFCLESDPNNTSGNCGHAFTPQIVDSTSPPGSQQKSATFAPWPSMTVTKDMSASVTTTGSASISFVQDAVDVSTVPTVPEPTTLSLTGIGLAIAYFGRRRTAK